MKTKKFLLPEHEIPTHWYNVVADMQKKPQRLRNPQTNEPMKNLYCRRPFVRFNCCYGISATIIWCNRHKSPIHFKLIKIK